MRNLNLNDANTPDTLVVTLRQASEQFAEDAANMDAADFLSGKVWQIVAQELERAADRIVRRAAKSGYPWDKQVL